MSALDEEAWWNGLGDEDALLNTAGDPPYNVVSVGIRILNSVDPLRLLDLGCGMGRLTNMIARRLLPDEGVVHGVDVSRRLLDAAVTDANQRGLSNVHYWHGDGRTLPSGLGGRLSGAYSVAMFQHIPSDAMWGYLRHVHERLEPGGVFVFTIALGDEDTFLNHQIPDVSSFAQDLAEIYNDVMIEPLDEIGWTWVTARKATYDTPQ